MPLRLFMNQPFSNFHENQQFEELLRLLVKLFYFNDKELCDCFADFNFEMNGKTKQYDVIIFRKHLIAIIELKDKLGQIQGATNGASWTVAYFPSEGKPIVEEQAFFQQVTEQRHNLLTYLKDKEFVALRHKQPGEDHFLVDVLLVFRSGSEIDVSYTNDQIKRWFAAISMDNLERELTTRGSDRFMLTPSDVKYLADQIGLRERDPLHYYAVHEVDDERHLNLLRLIGGREDPATALGRFQHRLSALRSTPNLERALEASRSLLNSVSRGPVTPGEVADFREAVKALAARDDLDEVLEYGKQCARSRDYDGILRAFARLSQDVLDVVEAVESRHEDRFDQIYLLGDRFMHLQQYISALLRDLCDLDDILPSIAAAPERYRDREKALQVLRLLKDPWWLESKKGSL
jgi:hypothetical protein